MKEPSTKSVDTEATPVVAGGSDKIPKIHDKKRIVKNWLVVGGIVAVLVTIFAVWWMVIRQDPNYLNITGLNTGGNKALDQAKLVAQQPVPKDATERANYYAMIGSYLQSGKQYTYAEHYLLTAQKVADDNKLDTKIYRYYTGLADIYRALGNKSKASEYDNKEQKFLESNYSADVLKQMKDTPTDAPHQR